MTEAPPILMQWDGETFRPVGRHAARQADKYYCVGENYQVIEHHQRSGLSHRHYHASIEDAFRNLPEDQAERWPTIEHFRKWLLIKTGFHNSTTLTCSSKAEAVRVAAFLRPVDEFSIVVVKDATVTRYTAKSQSYRAMNRAEFQDSKDKTLALASDMIGTTTKALETNAEKVA